GADPVTQRALPRGYHGSNRRSASLELRPACVEFELFGAEHRRLGQGWVDGDDAVGGLALHQTQFDEILDGLLDVVWRRRRPHPLRLAEAPPFRRQACFVDSARELAETADVGHGPPGRIYCQTASCQFQDLRRRTLGTILKAISEIALPCGRRCS